MNFNKLFLDFTKLKVAVVGDIMLDTYWWGNVDRISPEAPVPIVALHHKELRIGGGGNVALNTVALGASTILFSVVGNDGEGKALISLLKNNNVNTDNIITSNDRITTNKTRIISRNQHMMRLDAEMTSDINLREQELLLNNFENFIKAEKPDVVIFEDYNKGVMTKGVIEKMIKACSENNIITTVDPKRKNFFLYRDVTIFKPNLKEVQEGLSMLIDEVDETTLQQIHLKLESKLGHKISLVTLSEKGMFYQHKQNSGILPTHVRSIADVSGAGDTVIAVVSLVYAATNDIKVAATLANLAGGIVCEEVGTVPINRQKLLDECISLIANNLLQGHL